MTLSRSTNGSDDSLRLDTSVQHSHNIRDSSQHHQFGVLSSHPSVMVSVPSPRRISQPLSKNTFNVSQPNLMASLPQLRVDGQVDQTSGSRAISKENFNDDGGGAGCSGEQEGVCDAKSVTKIDATRPMSTRSNGLQMRLSRPGLRSMQSSQLSAPKSVRDLGSDYTRYYNPFATSKSQSEGLNMPMRLAADKAMDEQNVPMLDTKRSSIGSRSWTQSSSEDSAPAAGSYFPLEIPDLSFDSCPPYVDDRLNAPYALPLFTDEKEDDDDMHLPQWDDDIRYKAHWREHCSFTNIVNCVGGIMVVLGLMCAFIALPIISWTGISILEYPYDTPDPPAPEPWAYVNSRPYPLLRNVRTDLIDPDTPQSAMIRKSTSGGELMLVFSDEFNEQNRTFYPGDDPYWFAPDIWYGATKDLEWYDPDAVNTGGGTLQIQLDRFANHGLDYRSGMLNSWNQVCFKGGVFEVSVSLPGPAGVHGLWPGIWTMGNLGRPGYLSTTDGLWPYTYNTCDTGITPNQSTTDGISNLPGQRLPSCSCAGADHPTPGTGRGAPEIDIAEVSADYGGMGLGVATQSFQVAPFDIWYYPNYEFMETPNYSISFVNTYTGGPYQQAVSTTSMLNNDWYDGKEYQKYAYEYTPGDNANASITWFIGDDETMKFDARAIGPNGNIGQRLISEEPMSMILNLGFSHSWTYIKFDDLKFPTVLQVDYVRWYQAKDAQIVTCDPPGYGTTDYIAKHPEAYNNPNHTHWTDAGYDWPKNVLMHSCLA